VLPPADSRPIVLVIGAGAAGLSAARQMRPWAEVVVVDKGRGVGGRLATRRIGEATLDHGAQFLTTHEEPFRSFVEDLAEAGIVQPWFAGSVGPGGVAAADSDGHVRWRAAGGMTAIAKHLATSLDVRCGHRVDSLGATGRGWLVVVESAELGVEQIAADAVVLTAPVPQSLALLGAGGVELSDEDASALESIHYDPCLAVLAPLHAPWCLPPPGAVRGDGPVLAWMADNQLKGVSDRPAITLHATASTSRSMWSEPDQVVAATLLAAASEMMGGEPPDVDIRAVQVQRWRYSIPTSLHPHSCIEASEVPPLVFAGDAFGGPRVEGAVTSGWAAADALHRRLVDRTDR